VTLTNLEFASVYAVYYDDAQREHTTPAYVATRYPQNAQHNYAIGRHYVGSLKTVDAAGAGSTTGGGPPAGSGYTAGAGNVVIL
jgi:hypothetical protein